MSAAPQPVLGQFVSKIQLRFLQSTDITELKVLCKDWFPIDYPDVWYTDVTSNSRFFALAATLQNKIIGVIVAEVKSRHRSNKEDSNILGFWYPVDTKVAYILILGVAEPYRRKGVASLLLDTFLAQVNSVAYSSCKAVYLHVLASNTAALQFYKERNFAPHRYLPMYYAIDGLKVDGYSYVLYINGGEPPWTLVDLASHSLSLVSKWNICSLPGILAGKFIGLLSMVPWTSLRNIQNM